MPNTMDKPTVTPKILQQSEKSAGTTIYSPNSDMSKRYNHSKSDKPSAKEYWCFSRQSKVSLITFRRSWNLKFLLLSTTAFLCAMCLYSDVVSIITNSLSSSLPFRVTDGNKINRGNVEFKWEDSNLEFQKARETRDSKEMNKNVPKGEKRFPSSIIFGVSKCGTRAVMEYLKLHPNVVAPMAEVNFFNNETLFQRGALWYLQQMPYAKENQIVVEKSPDYFQNPECAPMIRRMNSTIKLLLLLRDPVERLVSQYMQLVDKNPSLPVFEEWVLHPVSKEVNTHIRSVMVSAYAKYLETWLSMFPDNQILIIEATSLRQDPLFEMKRVEKFLNLKPYFKPSDFYFNDTRGFHCIRYRSTGKTKCLGKSKGRQHIAVEERVFKQLRMFYEPYNRKINDMLGVRFPWSSN